MYVKLEIFPISLNPIIILIQIPNGVSYRTFKIQFERKFTHVHFGSTAHIFYGNYAPHSTMEYALKRVKSTLHTTRHIFCMLNDFYV